MKLFSRLRGPGFCAFCRSKRQLYVKKHVDLTNVVGLLVLSAVTTYGVWGDADPRGLFIFSLLILGAEFFVYLRWRSAIVCKMCGFDPVIYKRSPSAAAEMVNKFYVENTADPKFMMSRSPLIEVHRRSQAQERKKEERRAFLERQTKRTADAQVLAAARRESPRVASPPPVR